jgi:single-strand DNA-binding protein
MINKLTLIGRAGKDARVGVTQKGTEYASVSLASGSKENTSWFDVVAFDKQAEWLAKATKGAMVYVEGPVSLSAYKAKDGTERTTLQVTAYQVRLLSGRDEQQSQAQSYDVSDESDVPF